MTIKSINIKKPNSIKSNMIAPCGMNCALCSAFHREKNHCPGCLLEDVTKSKYCIECIIKNCDQLDLAGRKKYCYTCKEFPCKRIKQMDKRYSTKYGMSVIENLEYIKEKGIRKFVQNERHRWTCQHCGGLIVVHKENCLYCNQPKI
jgi:hypothetical protein